MLFITNKPPLTAMGDVLHDHDLAEAIVDRVLKPLCLSVYPYPYGGLRRFPSITGYAAKTRTAPLPLVPLSMIWGAAGSLSSSSRHQSTPWAIKVAFDGLGALLVIGQLPATRGRPR